jgi:hypothetical protein
MAPNRCSLLLMAPAHDEQEYTDKRRICKKCGAERLNSSARNGTLSAEYQSQFCDLDSELVQRTIIKAGNGEGTREQS